MANKGLNAVAYEHCQGGSPTVPRPRLAKQHLSQHACRTRANSQVARTAGERGPGHCTASRRSPLCRCCAMEAKRCACAVASSSVAQRVRGAVGRVRVQRGGRWWGGGPTAWGRERGVGKRERQENQEGGFDYQRGGWVRVLECG